MTDKKHEEDVAFIRALAELLRENDLTELQVKRDYGEDDSLNVRVSRMTPAPVAAAYSIPPAPAPAAAAAPAIPAAAASAAPSDPADHPAPSHRQWSALSTCSPNRTRPPSSASAAASPKATLC